MTKKPQLSFRVWLLTGLIILLAIACAKESAPPPPTPNPGIITLRGRTMGTTYSIKVVSPEKNKKQDIRTGIDALLQNINNYMSTYIKDSEISRFNAFDFVEWFDVAPDTARVVMEAQRISNLSGGAFDVTVGPLINLWGFGESGHDRVVPPHNKIIEVKEYTGYKKLVVRYNPPALKKDHPRLYCSLSAIAKGFGVDKTGAYLESLGYRDYMVEIGGEIRCRGFKPGEKPWRLAIEKPDGTRTYQMIIQLKDMSMATSGDYHNYFEKEGVRYSHTINPTTGRPITHTLASVTVLHSSCMTADGLATAINVMGPEKGFDLALKENLAVFMIIHKDNAFTEKQSPEFKRIVPNQEGVN